MDLGVQGAPWEHAPPPSFHKMHNISENIQIPTHKPYIYACSFWRGAFSDMDHGSQGGPPGAGPTPSFHKMCYISETVQIPPINHIYSCSLR